MFNIFQAAAILDRHSALAQTLNQNLPEFQQAVSEVDAWLAKSQTPTKSIEEAQALYKKHGAMVATLKKITPEFQQALNELLALMQQARQYNMEMANKENPNERTS